MRSPPAVFGIRFGFLLGLSVAALGASAAEPSGWPSDTGAYTVHYESRLNPIEINAMHAWELLLTDANGAPVSGAVFQVSGGMPEHDHGLPTAPRVTAEVSAGRYLLEGLRFHMTGTWALVIDFEANGYTDRVTITLTLGPQPTG